jgi:hypothetical protein
VGLGACAGWSTAIVRRSVMEVSNPRPSVRL